MKYFLKQLIPPAFTILFNRFFKYYGWSGNYTSWEEAKRHCTGYDSDMILNKVKDAALKVQKGEALFERDSVLFYSEEYNWPLLSGMMWIAAQNKGDLSVADFGGSLGSSYFQNKKFLDRLNSVTWSVIEQNNFVSCGKEYFQDDTLQFFYTIDQCITDRGIPEVLLLSGVLPYLEQPYEMLERLMQYRIPYIIIDNTYFNYENRDRISIQKVPPAIYEASYPCWFLNYDRVKTCIEKEYMVISEHVNNFVIFLNGKKIQYRGMLLKNNYK